MEISLAADQTLFIGRPASDPVLFSLITKHVNLLEQKVPL